MVAVDNLATGRLDNLADLRADAEDLQHHIDELKRTASGFGRVADTLEKTVAAAQPGVQDFGQHGVYELQQFMTEGRALIVTLNRVIANFERDPARFLFGDQQKGVEAR